MNRLEDVQQVFFTVLIENVELNKLQSHVESQLNFFHSRKNNLTEDLSILKQWSVYQSFMEALKKV
jgi:hypothetical protein